jgi:hypothetical protein
MATYVNCKLKLDPADHKALLRAANVCMVAANEDPFEPDEELRAHAAALLELKANVEAFEKVAAAEKAEAAKKAKADAKV